MSHASSLRNHASILAALYFTDSTLQRAILSLIAFSNASVYQLTQAASPFSSSSHHRALIASTRYFTASSLPLRMLGISALCLLSPDSTPSTSLRPAGSGSVGSPRLSAFLDFALGAVCNTLPVLRFSGLPVSQTPCTAVFWSSAFLHPFRTFLHHP